MQTLPLFVLLAFGFNICQSAEDKKPHVVYISPEQITSIGDSVKLDCTIDDFGRYAVFWKKQDRERPSYQVVVSVNENVLVRDERFSLALKNNTGEKTVTLSLAIKDIKVTDAGLYECVMDLDLTNKVSQTVEVQVRSPPRIIDSASTLQIKVKEGDLVQLKCAADGYPRPDITWSRENGAILPMGGKTFKAHILTIKTVQKEDRGVYYCIANNNVDQGAQRSVTLQVEFAPVISVYRPKVAQAHGYSIDLECNVQANPAPQIVWTKNDVELLNDGTYQITHLGTTNDLTLSKLKIVSVDKHSYGEYKCKASNQHGLSEARLQLYKPVIPVQYANNLV